MQLNSLTILTTCLLLLFRTMSIWFFELVQNTTRKVDWFRVIIRKYLERWRFNVVFHACRQCLIRKKTILIWNLIVQRILMISPMVSSSHKWSGKCRDGTSAQRTGSQTCRRRTCFSPIRSLRSHMRRDGIRSPIKINVNYENIDCPPEMTGRHWHEIVDFGIMSAWNYSLMHCVF